MACFAVPVAEAVIATATKKVIEKKEETKASEAAVSTIENKTAHKIPFSRKLGWLTKLLWGGSILLAFEHLWHGEIVPYFPFLTAMSNPEDTAEMLHEIATVGVTMALLVTAVWCVMLVVSAIIEKKAEKAKQDKISE
jgi:hypothetical protein